MSRRYRYQLRSEERFGAQCRKCCPWLSTGCCIFMGQSCQQHPMPQIALNKYGNTLQFGALSIKFCWVFPCFGLWLTISFSRTVFHPVECSYCHSESMMGFRYRCQQCHNYQLCQDCFWRGHASGSHSNQHQMKEYTSWVREGSCLAADCFALQPSEKPPATALGSCPAQGSWEPGWHFGLVTLSGGLWPWEPSGERGGGDGLFRVRIWGACDGVCRGEGSAGGAGSRAPGSWQLLPFPQDSR